jgi:hypothetical protein
MEGSRHRRNLYVTNDRKHALLEDYIVRSKLVVHAQGSILAVDGMSDDNTANKFLALYATS